MALSRSEVPSYAGKGLNAPVSWYLNSTPVRNSSGDVIGYSNDSFDPLTGSFKSSGSGSSAVSATSASTDSLLSGVSLGALSGSGSGGSLDSLLKMLQEQQAQNNSWSAAQAQRQMDFQRSEADRAMEFNHDEAELSRAWTQMMSDTAHQREVKDLQAAGLNPVLSAYGGQGAPVTSGVSAASYQTQPGAKGDTDTSFSTALVHLLGSVISAQASMTNQAVSAATQESVADKYTAMSHLVAQLQSDTSLSVAGIQSMASQYAADVHADASKVAAAISAAAHKYGYDVMAESNEKIAAFNAEVNERLQKDRIQAEFDIRDAYPTTMFGAISSLFGNLFQPGENRGLSSLGSITSLLGKGISNFIDGFFK